MRAQRLQNLNHAVITNADGPDVWLPDARAPTMAMDGRVEIHFDNLESALVKEITDHTTVVGCVAWLTNERVLRALSGCEMVSMIVNKEDFLRPDKGNWSQRKIKELYSKIRDGCRISLGAYYSIGGDPTYEAVRCVGVSSDRKNVPPRMHHKFLVFCEIQQKRFNYTNHLVDPPSEECEERDVVIPVAVWTGSFNASENGTRSLENVIIIRDKVVAAAYYSEWKTLLGISEPLNWESEYVYPEWRIGT